MVALDFVTALRVASAARVSADGRTGPVVRRAGPSRLQRAARFRPFDVLPGAVKHRRLSGQAAADDLAVREGHVRLSGSAALISSRALRAPAKRWRLAHSLASRDCWRGRDV